MEVRIATICKLYGQRISSRWGHEDLHETAINVGNTTCRVVRDFVG